MVLFIGYRSDMDKLLSAFDLFVMPSRFEGHPMGLIEALANGLPALVTRGCNMLDEILSSNAGWVCETSENDLEKTILMMINYWGSGRRVFKTAVQKDSG